MITFSEAQRGLSNLRFNQEKYAVFMVPSEKTSEVPLLVGPEIENIGHRVCIAEADAPRPNSAPIPLGFASTLPEWTNGVEPPSMDELREISEESHPGPIPKFDPP